MSPLDTILLPSGDSPKHNYDFRGLTKSAPPLPLLVPRYNAQISGQRCTEGWLYYSKQYTENRET